MLPKISEHERNNIKIGAKIFINKPCPQQLESAIDYLLNTLKIDYLDNLILSYHLDNQLNGLIKHQNGDNINGGTSNDQLIDHLKLLWKILENYATTEKINQLGIADIDTDTLIELYSDCEIKPTIVQINLAACCVVPPSLQEFCATHEIQLLTHSDPEGNLSTNIHFEIHCFTIFFIGFFFCSLILCIVVLTRNDIAGVDDAFKEFVPVWTSRYQVHVKCRGVLAAKGFIIGADRIDS